MYYILKKFIESRYAPLILSIIGYYLAILSVIVFLNINSVPERILWGIIWLVCCSISDNLFWKFKNYKK